MQSVADGIDTAWWYSLMWEGSLCVCPHLGKICTGTQVWKSHPQRTYSWAVTDQINQQSQSWRCTTGFWQLKQQKGIYEFSSPWFAALKSMWVLKYCGTKDVCYLTYSSAGQRYPVLDMSQEQATESQNGWGWKGPLEVIWSIPL